MLRVLKMAARPTTKSCRSRLSSTAGGPSPSKKAATAAAGGGGEAEATAVVVSKAIGIGGGAGMLGSLVGMGGGFVAIPALTGWLRLTQHQAHGTSLGAVFATGAAGSTAYALSGHVDFEAAAAMAVTGMAAAHVGARSTIGISPSSLKLALGVLMVAVAPLLPLRDEIMSRSRPGGKREGGDEQASEPAGVERIVKIGGIGLGSGFLAGVFGVGGGVVTVPAMSLATDLDHKKVLGTSLAAMVLPAMIGSVTHYRQGNLVPRIALPLAAGTGFGAFLGGKYAAKHLDEASLKLAFSCMMLVLGARTISGARAASVAAKRIK